MIFTSKIQIERPDGALLESRFMVSQRFGSDFFQSDTTNP